jgi:hypothetical protein
MISALKRSGMKKISENTNKIIFALIFDAKCRCY